MTEGSVGRDEVEAPIAAPHHLRWIASAALLGVCAACSSEAAEDVTAGTGGTGAGPGTVTSMVSSSSTTTSATSTSLGTDGASSAATTAVGSGGFATTNTAATEMGGTTTGGATGVGSANSIGFTAASGGTTTSVTGSSGGSAGTAGAVGGMGGSDVGSGGNGGSGPNPCDSAVLCEGFESTELGEIPNAWSLQGDVGVASDQARSGSRSLKVGRAENGPRRITRSAMDFGSGHFGRIFYRVEQPVPSAFVHATFVSLGGNDSEYRVVDTVKNDQGDHQFLYNIQPPGNEWGCGSDYDHRFDDQWHCAEWEIDSVSQTFRYYVDGAELDEIGVSGGQPNASGCDTPPAIPSTFDDIRIGLYNYQTAPPGFVVWIDDIVISHSRVGCASTDAS